MLFAVAVKTPVYCKHVQDVLMIKKATKSTNGTSLFCGIREEKKTKKKYIT